MLNILITNQQDRLPIDSARLRAAIETVFTGEGITGGEVSLAVLDDPTIHDLNRRWLDHDEPTDVLSFVLEESDGYREGEIIVSADTALARAAEFAWPAETELLLYVVHGTLHLVGYDDKEPGDREQMRERERFYLERLGIKQGSGFRVQGSEDAQAEPA
ncbi:MAG TPA: rRNA maturation RNase YbeY [Pirellulales bacterium]|nr:rRNA maturation RNase YbeY [Pirellulales bacterium]